MQNPQNKKKIVVKVKKTKKQLPTDISDIYREREFYKKKTEISTPEIEIKTETEKKEQKQIQENQKETKVSESFHKKLSEKVVSNQPQNEKLEVDEIEVKKNIQSVSEESVNFGKAFDKEKEALSTIQKPKESATIEEKIEKKEPLKKFFHHKSQKDVELKKQHKDKEKENERIFDKKENQKKKETPKPVVQSIPKEITITENIQVSELAKKLNVKATDVIAKLMKLGEMVTINQVIDSDTAILVASEFGCDVKVVSLYEETLIKEEEDKPEDRIVRPPVVTIMGHVDHGKTKLLDTIRKSNVVEKEAGAITQHIGAYQVTTSKGKITFLDTPGHEAFTAMRARGASITDIVVLVVAADDGVKEQTVEAIRHAQAANVPIIVAINKIDLPTANPERVKQELVQYGLQPEEWGGDTIFCEISAKNNIGIDHLLEMILIQAELLELKANPKVKPVGTVIESKKDPGKGPVATILIQKGTLKEGMNFVVGIYPGKVRAMFDDFSRRLYEAPPSTPVEIIGLENVPEPGDPFQVVDSEKEAREIASKRQYYKQISQSKKKHPTWGDLESWTKENKELRIIVKADVHGSVEAIRDGLLKLSNDEVKVNVIYAAAGPITESDVNLAIASNALIVAFQIRATTGAQELAEKNNIDIRYYSIIYNLLEDMEKALKGMLEPQYKEEITGEAEVRQVFKISKVGNVAGCMVIKGRINRNDKLRLIRNGVVVYEGVVDQLKRFKDDVVEVAEGYECGISIKGYNDIKERDILEFYKIVEYQKV
ncbi:MAG: translation initiation factor IF-2 [Leptonema sp. (in: bacteria)]